jgi:gliding motility-associated-like protein
VKSFFFFLLLFIPFAVLSQSPADWWYFGDSAGVHFTSSGPIADTNGQLNSFEGCASISSSNGDLLFYSDGTTVYNANHLQMPNGFGLNGNISSTQSAIIVPFPGSTSKYFIFTTGQLTGLYYSVVDMNLEAGLGDVIVAEKNVFMHGNSGENICATKHGSDQSYWIIAHLIYSDSIVAFNLTATGLTPTPVISLTGDSILAAQGSIKASPNGNYLAFGSSNLSPTPGLIQFMQFNNLTGQVDDVLSLSTPNMNFAYGVEFSDNSQVLYAAGAGTNGSAITQYDVSIFDSATIVNSEYVVTNQLGIGQMQLGPDLKVYIASPGLNDYLHRINSPNSIGTSCGFELNAVFLNGRTANMGLPPFISSFFNTGLSADGFCFTDSTFFFMDASGVDSVLWNFGDPTSGANDTSTAYQVAHVFTDTGTFTVQLIAWSNTLVDTVFQSIQIYPIQQIDFGQDTMLCLGDTFPLSIRQPYASFLWNDSSEIDSAIIVVDTVVWATVFGVCDTVSDTISVMFDQPVIFDFGPDSSFCVGDSFVLDAALPTSTTFSWNTTDTLDSILIQITGEYILVASNICGVFSDSINLVFNPTPSAQLLPEDTINCFDEPVFLSRTLNDSLTFIWPDSSTDETFRVDTTSLVWLAVFNKCGFSVDTMKVVFNGEIKTELGEDITICPGDSIALNGADSSAIYLWNTGETKDTIFTDQVDKTYSVTITLNDCQKIESKRVDISDFACDNIDCKVTYSNVFSPNGDGVNDVWRTRTDCVDNTYDLSIYNRWGQLVHTSNRRNYGWDGYINGEPAATGVYFFVMEFTDGVVVNVDNQAFRGSITLVR